MRDEEHKRDDGGVFGLVYLMWFIRPTGIYVTI